jgi:hypothetical protein
MSGTLAMTGRRVAITLAWSRSPRRRTAAEMTDVGMPARLASVPPSPLTPTERASRAGHASAAAKTQSERSEAASRAARAAHSPVGAARKLAAKWADASEDERREIRRVLRDAGVIPEGRRNAARQPAP